MQHMTSRRRFLVGSSLTVLAACGSGPPPRPSFDDIHFIGAPPIRLDVAAIDIVHEYQPKFEPPHLEEKLPIPLPHVVENWAHDRLRAAGTKGRAVATIIDASAVEIHLPTQGGLTGTFTKQADTEYDAVVGLRVDIKDERGFTVRTATARAQHTRTTIEGITPNERDRILYQMETELMADLDRQLETDIRSNFGFYVV